MKEMMSKGNGQMAGLNVTRFSFNSYFLIKHLDQAISNLKIQMHVCLLAELLQSCWTLCYPLDYSRPGSSVHGIL